MLHPIKILRDIVYADIGGRKLLTDLYLPLVGRPVPAIIFVHGGGWAIGDRTLAPDLKRHFAEAGFAMVSIDYRLSGEAVFPAAVEDVRTAIRWLRRSADGYGIDPARIGLWGSSAGAHLAVLSQTLPPALFPGAGDEEMPDRVQAVLNGYGPTDFLQIDAHRDPDAARDTDPESIQLPVGTRSADPDSMESRFIGAPLTEDRERTEAANPISYIGTRSLPPMLIMHGLNDAAVPFHQSELLYAALNRHHHQAMLILVEGLGHGFFNRNDLDAAGPRTMHICRTRGCSATVEQRTIFDTARLFFTRCLTLPVA